jgi:hypothetical protein
MTNDISLTVHEVLGTGTLHPLPELVDASYVVDVLVHVGRVLRQELFPAHLCAGSSSIVVVAVYVFGGRGKEE